MTKFKEGDRVRILGKTEKSGLSGTGIKVGDIIKVDSIYSDYFRVVKDGTGFHFNYQDAELVKEDEVKFKVGDKVRILGKTNAYGLASTGLQIGDIVTVAEVGANYFIVINNLPYHFNFQDAELVKEDEKVEYKQLRDISGVEIEKAQGDVKCPEFNEEFVDYLQEFNYWPNANLSKLLLYANPKWIEFLIKHKFIEEVKPEFKSFTLTLKVDTKDELLTLWHRLNCNGEEFKEMYFDKGNTCRMPIPKSYYTAKMWRQVDNAVEEHIGKY